MFAFLRSVFLRQSGGGGSPSEGGTLDFSDANNSALLMVLGVL